MNSDLGHSAASASQASTTPPAIPPAIASIIENLHTQDNRITANPLFAVQQKRVIGGLGEDYADAFAWVCEEGIEAGAEEAAHLDALHDAGAPIPSGWRRVGYTEKWEFVTGCLTEQGCKDFIACNGHNLKEPRIYAYGSYRNAEWTALREWLMGLRGQRTVEGSPESGSRITPDAPASPAPPQGEREAFEAHWRELWGEELERVGTHYASNVACTAWDAWQARASLSASTQPAERQHKCSRWFEGRCLECGKPWGAPTPSAPENEQRLTQLLAEALGARHPAMDDLARLIFDARKGRAAQPAVSAEARDAARWRKWAPYLRTLRKMPFALAMELAKDDAAMAPPAARCDYPTCDQACGDAKGYCHKRCASLPPADNKENGK